MTQTWALEDHLCQKCGGRILRCVTGNGITGGGNPIYRCADCGNAKSGMGPQELCWCGMTHRRQQDTPYMCLPYSILKEHPEYIRYFRNCGCDPENGGDVGIVLVADLRRPDAPEAER